MQDPVTATPANIRELRTSFHLNMMLLMACFVFDGLLIAGYLHF